jgi:hypothetical protein
MGFVTKLMNVVNPKKLTISHWFNCQTVNPPSPGGENFTVMEWGGQNWGGFIGVNTNRTAAPGNNINIGIYGVTDSVDFADPSLQTGGQFGPGNPGAYGGNGSGVDHGNVWTPGLNIVIPQSDIHLPPGPIPNAVLQPNVWVHLFLALDTTAISSATFVGITPPSSGYIQATGWDTAWVFLNGQFFGATPNGSRPLQGAVPGFPSRGAMWSTAPCDQASYPGGPAGNPMAQDWPTYFMPPADSYNMIVPGFAMDVNGFEWGIPVQTVFAGTNLSICSAETQVWFGTFIDPNAYIGMFIDSHGKPVDPAVPANVFGPPQLLLRRNRRLGQHYSDNQGTLGGTFNVTGTVDDFAAFPP